MIVVDASALLAILESEAEADEFIRRIKADDHPMISAVGVLEAGMVMRGRQGPDGIADVMALVKVMKLEVVAFDADLATAALVAFDIYGKGIHSRARLNMGDCAAYALAKSRNARLLFKGDDFTATDIPSAVA